MMAIKRAPKGPGLVAVPADFAIQPSDISTKSGWSHAFDKHEAECTACRIVYLCQQHGSWRPLTLAEVGGYVRELADAGWLLRKAGQFVCTVAFVAQCYATAMAKVPTVAEPQPTSAP